MKPFPLLLFCLGPTILAAGCGPAALPQISGTVKFNGQPVEVGTIAFLPVDGKTSSAETRILKGEYRLEVPPGQKQVKIIGIRVTGQRPAYEGAANSPMIDITEQYIPANYNDQTTLTCEIKNSEVKDFDLK